MLLSLGAIVSACDRIDFVRGEQASFVEYPFYYIVGTDVKTGMT